MGQLEDLRAFVDVVNSNGIARAADTLNIAKSAVSRRLKLIEERYNTQLIDRRPGVWEITAAGHELYRRATQILEQAEDLDADFQETSQSLSGSLFLSLPSDFGLTFLGPFLTKFAADYPEIRLILDFDDRQVDLAHENYDFAVRISGDHSADLISRELASIKFALYASPSYLEAKGVPNSVEDLSGKSLLHYGPERRARWTFEQAGRMQDLEFHPTLNANTGLFLLESVESGLGIARLPDFIAKPSLEHARIVPALEDLVWPVATISLVHSEKRIFSRRMRVFEKEIAAACHWLSDIHE